MPLTNPMQPYPATSYEALREPHQPRAVSTSEPSAPPRDTLRGMRRAQRRNDPYKRPSTPPALTPFVRDQIEAAIQHLKEAAIDYGLAKDRAVKTKGYITPQSMAVLYEAERKLHAAAREYSQLFRFTQPKEVIHTRE